MNIHDAVKKVSEDIGVKFKDKQLEAIKCFCAGQDVFVSLPTGYGKSLIYAVLPLIFDRIKGKCLIGFINYTIYIKLIIGVKGSIAVCISPLTALMVEQVAKFNKLGITAEFVGEAQSDASAQKKVLNAEVQIVLISPENVILNPVYRNMFLSHVYKHRMIALVVDEAHCVRSW